MPGGCRGAARPLHAPLRAALVVLLAVGLDLAAGDPPNRWHPVAWLGALIARGRSRLARGGPTRLVILGALLTLGVTAVGALAATGIVMLAGGLGLAGLVLETVALKSVLAVRGLARAADRVAAALGRGDLVEARRAVGEHLVSRPTGALDAPAVASAAIESVAENLTDSVVAPLLCYLALGLPGAVAYRVVNTADAMLGYREGALQHFGKAAARLDDLLNLVPARVAALTLAAVAAASDADARRALRTMWRDHGRTRSPNAGWTMAAMAGALGVVLEKPGHYRLGGGPLPAARDIARASRLMVRGALAAAVSVALAATLLG